MVHRVLYVNTGSVIGGAEISLLALMHNLDPNRYEPCLLTEGKGRLADEVTGLGVLAMSQNFPWFSKRRFWEYPFSICNLARILWANDIDLIHSNCARSLRHVMWASKLTGVPYVSHVRDFVRGWFEPDRLEALNRAAQVIANSDATARVCVDRGIDAARVVTVYNPIDVEVLQAASPAEGGRIRQEFGIDSHAIVVGIVGQVQTIKGHQEFIEAGLQLLGELLDVHFLVVGEAHEEQNRSFLSCLREQVQSAGYAQHFHFAGFRNDIPVVMKAIDVLTVPSWKEPFGRVAVEGMAAGCAVIATDTGGLPEIMTDHVDGLLVPPKDVGALLSALRRLARDAALRERLSECGQESAERFTVSKHVRQMEAIYDAVLSEG